MVKVLMVGNDSSVKGGITSVISQMMYHDWSENGIDIKFIPTYIETNNLGKVLFFANAYRKIKKEINTKKPDIVHIHMSYKGSFIRKYLIHKLCKKKSIPDIIHIHGSKFEKWYEDVDAKKKNKIRTLLKEADAVIVLGEKWDETIKKIEPLTNTVIVSNAVHIPEETVQWGEPFKILFLGVLIKRKGVTDLLKAAKLLKNKLGLDRFKVVIAGTGCEEENLKAETQELGIDDVVKFVGWTDGEKKIELLKKCQMLVLPSYNEGLPIAILEAMSYGMPVVATDVGDISTAVLDGENGYLVQVGNVEQLYNCLDNVICVDTFKKFSFSSKQRCISEFSENRFFDTISRIYKEI